MSGGPSTPACSMTNDKDPIITVPVRLSADAFGATRRSTAVTFCHGGWGTTVIHEAWDTTP